jgi:predicted lipoprotein with Yx(FWY)xxD motif
MLGGSLCALALGLAAACGGASAPASPTVASPAPAASDGAADGQAGMGHSGHQMGEGDGSVQLYAVQSGPLGVVVTDGEGRLVYGSEQDANDPPTSRCSGACAQEWLPVVVPPGQEPELLGVAAEKVGRVARDDGSSQLTLGGWPVYVNKDDDGQLTAPAPDAHGAWFVMTPQGNKKAV